MTDYSPRRVPLPRRALRHVGGVTTAAASTFRRMDLASVTLRMTSIGGKFLLLLYLTRYLSLHAVGIYGLFVATQAIVLQAVGFEFHAITIRRLLATAPQQRSAVVWTQLRFHGVAYVALALVSLGVLATDLLPSAYVHWFVLVLAGTHASQEAHRILIAISKARSAYLIMAIAHGLWVLPVIAAGLSAPSARTLDVVFGCWALSAVAAACLGIFLLQRHGLLDRTQSGSWADVRSAIAMCWRFLIIAGGYRIIDMSDRYFLQAHWGEAKVGVYTVYASVARVLQDVLYAGFVATLWPQLVTAYQQRDEPAFEAQRFRMNRVVVRTVLVLVPAFCAGIHGLLWLLDRPALHEEIASYYVLVAATATLSLGTVPNYTLYAAGQDRAILQAVTLGFVSNIVLNAVLIPAGGTLGAAVATLAAICVIVVYQLIVQHRMKRMGVV